jgi:ribosome-associated protein
MKAGKKRAPGQEMDSLQKSLLCVKAARSKRAKDLVVLDLRELVSYTDYFVICTGRSDRQVQAISEHLEKELRIYDQRPLSIEGFSAGRWILMDYGDVIVHIFQQPVREFYDLEGLWCDAPTIPLPPEPEEEQTPEDEEEMDQWEEI